MEGASPSFFPANYVTLKDLQERWIKRKQEEENEAKLRRLREQEKIKSRSEKEAKNRQLKSKNPIRSATKPLSSSAAPASYSQGRERKQKNLASGSVSNERKVKVFDAKSEKNPTANAGRSRRKKRLSGRSRMPRSESESVVEVADKSQGRDRMAEICRTVADLSVAGCSNRRGGARISDVGGRGARRGGGEQRVSGLSASGTGMVWVRKTTES